MTRSENCPPWCSSSHVHPGGSCVHVVGEVPTPGSGMGVLVSATATSQGPRVTLAGRDGAVAVLPVRDARGMALVLRRLDRADVADLIDEAAGLLDGTEVVS